MDAGASGGVVTVIAWGTTGTSLAASAVSAARTPPVGICAVAGAVLNMPNAAAMPGGGTTLT